MNAAKKATYIQNRKRVRSLHAQTMMSLNEIAREVGVTYKAAQRMASGAWEPKWFVEESA